MKTRVLVGLGLTALVLGVVLLAPLWATVVLIGIALLLAQDELLCLPGRPPSADRVAAAVACTILVYLASARCIAPAPVTTATFLPLSIAGLLVLVLLSPSPIETAARRASLLLAGLTYVVFLGSHGAKLVCALGPDHGRAAILLVAAVTWLGDSAAYFAGVSLGRHRLYPLVSPKKTVEGSIGGLAGSVLGALAVRALFWAQLPLAQTVGFAVVGGVAGQLGDLVESVFKRSFGVKDSSSLIPGHGGMLDRIDAFLLVAPLGYYWLT